VPEIPTWRMLITASRDWPDIRPIEQAIRLMAMEAAQLGRDLVVVHGNAQGGDKLAQSVVRGLRSQGWTRIHEESHPAPWDAECTARCPRANHRRKRRDGSDFCPAVGLYRDEEMVKLGADSCFAFIMPCVKRGCLKPKPHGSHGASKTADMAQRAGIPTTRITHLEAV
jgi:hypothetical protein